MILGLAVVVACLHVAAGVLLVAARVHWPMMLGFAGVAYTLGMRHGFDADHIVAIDGTTRHLLARGRRANGVGLFFSLGHSTVVLLLALWIASAAQRAGRDFPILRLLGSAVGLAASSLFMVLMALLNALIFRDTLLAIRRSDAGRVLQAPAGIMTRLCGSLLRMIDTAPQLYFVGLVFGLGFDTASEIGLLAIAATAAARALPLHVVLVLPLSSGRRRRDARARGW